MNVSSLGIDTITIGNNDNKIVKCFDDWNDIYNYVKNDKIIKIIKYQNEFKDEICTFINDSMFTFIDRPYKDRPDVSNIEEYYLKNNGNFWLAIDVKTKKIIGSIALENKDKYGILKRFYVNKEYQKLGIGNRLYKILYNFVKQETSI